MGKLAEFSDSGIAVHFFVGNHDLWMRDYLETEVGIKVHHDNIIIREGEKELFIGHGDGLGPGEQVFKLVKQFFRNKACQWIFARLHPNTALKFAHNWSRKSRIIGSSPDYLGSKKEYLELAAVEHQIGGN